MLKKSFIQGLVLSFVASLLPATAVQALPGQPVEEVQAWIQSHPTLRPKNGEKLFITKTDTAAQRFSFQASVVAPGTITFNRDRSMIRSERISMFDAINGLNFNRLEESLRVIYGLDIYQDFRRAQVVYSYPNLNAVNSARMARTPIREALKGELRLGDRYAYWMEIAKPRNGIAYTGQMTVLLKSDLEKIQSELRNR